MSSLLLDGMSEQEFLAKLSDRKWRHKFMGKAISKSLAITLRENRLARGLTQKEFGALCGMSEPRISLLETEKGMERVTINALLKIAKALDCALIVRFEAWEDDGVIRGFVTWVLGFTKEGCIVRRFDSDTGGRL